MNFKLPVSKENYTKAVLSTVNTFLQMSPKEIEVLVAMIENNIHTLDTASRELLRGALNMDQANLNTYIHRLKKGNNIVSMNNELSINPNILKVIKDREITFTFETH